MKLYELFNQPVQVEPYGLHDKKFFIDGDGPYTVHFMLSDDENLSINPDIVNWVDSYVGDKFPNIYYVAFYYKMSATPTNLRQPYKVFSTVIDIIKKFIPEYEADFITFAAKGIDTSRAKLYHRMARTLGKDYRTIYDSKNDETKFLVKV